MKQPRTKKILKWERGIKPAAFGSVFYDARQMMPALCSEAILMQGNCSWDASSDLLKDNTALLRLRKSDGSDHFLVVKNGELKDQYGSDLGGWFLDPRVTRLWQRLNDLYLFLCTGSNEEDSGILIRPEYILILRASPAQAYLIPSPALSGDEIQNLPALVQEHHPGRFLYDPGWSKPSKESIGKAEPAKQFVLQRERATELSKLSRLFFEAKLVMPEFYDEISLTIGNCPWEPLADEDQGYMGRTRLTKRDGASDFLMHRRGWLNYASGDPVDCRITVFWHSLKDYVWEHRAYKDTMNGIGVLVRPEYILLFHPDPAQAFVTGAPDLTGHETLNLPEMVMAHYPGRFIDHTA